MIQRWESLTGTSGTFTVPSNVSFVNLFVGTGLTQYVFRVSSGDTFAWNRTDGFFGVATYPASSALIVEWMQ